MRERRTRRNHASRGTLWSRASPAKLLGVVLSAAGRAWGIRAVACTAHWSAPDTKLRVHAWKALVRPQYDRLQPARCRSGLVCGAQIAASLVRQQSVHRRSSDAALQRYLALHKVPRHAYGAQADAEPPRTLGNTARTSCPGERGRHEHGRRAFCASSGAALWHRAPQWEESARTSAAVRRRSVRLAYCSMPSIFAP